CAICLQEFGLQPEADGPLTAAEKLASNDGPWAALWARFADTPAHYPGVVEQLRRVQPRELFFNRCALPSVNAKEEATLRDALRACIELDTKHACDRIVALESEHASRREWVWSKLGQSDMVETLQHLAHIAEVAGSGL